MQKKIFYYILTHILVFEYYRNIILKFTRQNIGIISLPFFATFAINGLYSEHDIYFTCHINLRIIFASLSLLYILCMSGLVLADLTVTAAKPLRSCFLLFVAICFHHVVVFTTLLFFWHSKSYYDQLHTFGTFESNIRKAHTFGSNFRDY